MLKSAQSRTVEPASLTKSNCWRGCRSVAARLATGKQKGSYPSSRLADGAYTTGPVCKPRSCAANKAGRGEPFAFAVRCTLGMVRPGPQTARGWPLTDRTTGHSPDTIPALDTALTQTGTLTQSDTHISADVCPKMRDIACKYNGIAVASIAGKFKERQI